eukprot:scaffold46783_cov51-Phaeocystis_antarctica.AAC.2
MAWEPHLRGSFRALCACRISSRIYIALHRIRGASRRRVVPHLDFVSSFGRRVAQPSRTRRSSHRKVARCAHPWHSASNSRPSASPIATEAPKCSSASALS